MYPPINKQKAYKFHTQHTNEFPVSNKIGKKGLWLPSAAQLKDEEIKYICNTIKDFYAKK